MITSAIFLLTFDAGSTSGSGRPPGEEKATHSSILAWKMPWTEELGRLQSTGSQSIRYDSATEHACMYFQIRGLRYWGGAIILTTTSNNNEWKVITQSFIHSFNKYAVHSRNCTRKDALKALVGGQPRRLTATVQNESDKCFPRGKERAVEMVSITSTSVYRALPHFLLFPPHSF